MQTVNDSFITHATQKTRRPSYQVLIDWDIDDAYDDESGFILKLEGQRALDEPLNGIHQAQMDITLSNVTGRYSPFSDSPLSDLLRINRRMKMLVGFNGENIPFGRGISEVPEIDEGKSEATIHFWDELEVIQKHKLTDGSDLFTDIRTDLYIWEVLDAVYEPHFFVVASFDTDETWTGDGDIDTVNMRGGDGAMKLTSTSGSMENAVEDVSWDFGIGATWDDPFFTWDDLEAFWDATTEFQYDKIAMFIFVDDVTKIETLTMRLHQVTDDNFADLDITQYDLVNGWNQLWIPIAALEAFSSDYPISTWFKIGTSLIEGSDVIGGGFFNFSVIERVEFIFEAKPSQTTFVIIDEVRFVNSLFYPRRYMDIGLQTIPVATFSGNTALFEIRTAAESEGARFYADEDGALHYENREFYNNNEDSRVSQALLDFSRVIESKHPRDGQGVINSVKVKINPRVIQPTKEIWRYGETSLINNGDTITVWASFNDPVPTTPTGLITPVSTTDFTANNDADGGGADRTSDVSIAITKFSTSAKLEITNVGATPFYLTLLKLRGTPAEQQGEIIVRLFDQDSIDRYGEEVFEVENKYLASIDYANTLAQVILNQYKSPIDRVDLDHPALPHLQIGDMVTVVDEYTDRERLMRILAIAISQQNGQLFKQVTRVRSISNFETLDFFEIGTSLIGGTDVIAA